MAPSEASHAVGSRLPRPLVRIHEATERKYGKSPAFRMIAAAGPTSVSEEMTLPSDSPPAVKKWLSDGYTPAKYLGAWEKALHVYADSFPNQCVSLAAPGLPILERGNPVVLRVCPQSKTSSNGHSRSLDAGLQFNRTIFMPASRRSKFYGPILYAKRIAAAAITVLAFC